MPHPLALGHHALNLVKPLHQPRRHIAHLGQGKLLPDADPRAAVELSTLSVSITTLIPSPSSLP